MSCLYLLDKYLQKLPPFTARIDIIYLCPRKSMPPPGSPWYENVPVGKRKAQKFSQSDV